MGNKKILLISPGDENDIDGKITRSIPYLFARALFAPHAVTAVAALTPPGYDIEIHDENVRGPADRIILEKRHDIIGISITSNQLLRSLYLAGFAKDHHPGALVVAGGIGVENLLSDSGHRIDVVFHGEAEETWPRFLEDLKKNTVLPVYRTATKPILTNVPAPGWELLRRDLSSYGATLVQTTRGCPFDCSFCDVIYTYGRKPRSKTISQVIEEVKKLHTLNTRMIFFADDNFAGDKKFAKELLRQLIPLNNSFRVPIDFTTQIDITIAGDEELLTLLADCNFQSVMIGIESVNEESLKELNKQQNLRIPVAEAVKKIQSYGIIVLAHMIIGADSDGPDVFEKTSRFIAEANIVHHLCHPLAAPYGTKMWYELKHKGRIIRTEFDEINDKRDIVTNIIPGRMTRVELFEGLADYWENIYVPEIFRDRAISFLRNITYKPKIKEPGIRELWQMRRMLWRVFTYFLFDMGKEHRKVFFSIIAATARKGMYLMPKVIYLYTCYLIDSRRSKHDAEVAREHARWEKENPDKIVIDTAIVPVWEKIREHATPVFHTAYHQVRQRISSREKLYSTVITAMVDYNDRFGPTLQEVDEYQQEQIRNSCDRIMDQQEFLNHDTSGELPVSPPPGFAREILDALDSAVRYRNMNE